MGLRRSFVSRRTGRPSGMTAHTATWGGMPSRAWIFGSCATASDVIVSPNPSCRAPMRTFHANG